MILDKVRGEVGRVGNPDRDCNHNYKGVYDIILDKVRAEVGRVGNPDWNCSHNYKGVYDMILDKVRGEVGRVGNTLTETAATTTRVSMT